MKITKQVYLHGEHKEFMNRGNNDYGPGIEWAVVGYSDAKHWGPLAAVATVTFEVKDDFDPRPGMVEALKREKEELRAEMQSKLNKIDEQIGRLLALEAA